MRRTHRLRDEEIDAYVRDIQMAILVVTVPPLAVEATVPGDPNDDPIVATAVLAKARYLCTLDRHLHHEAVIGYCADRGIEVVNDVEMLHRLRSGSA